MGKLFGTDGVRGVANCDLTGEMAFKIGRAAAFYLTGGSCSNKKKKPVMFLGKDTRISGDMLESALTAGINSAGVDVVKLGIIPTPGVSFLTWQEEVEGSAMISASHNPVADNGIKFFNEQGLKLTDQQENEIEDLIFKDYQTIPSPTHEKIGVKSIKSDLITKYIDFIVKSVENDFQGLKIVLDCANGAACYASPQAFAQLKADLIVINDQADGMKINVNSGSTAPGQLRKKVMETSADLGIAHDGDADRVLLIDDKGQLIDGDKIMAIIALDLLGKNRLKHKTLVTTAYSNFGLKECLDKKGAEIKITRNGDRYILKEMLENGYNLGGEKSGHIIYSDFNKTGDGLLTAVKIVEIMKNSGKSLRQLAASMQEWPQIVKSIKVEKKEEWSSDPEIKEKIKKAEDDLGTEGRVFVRASGTEPVVRLMLEAKDEKKVNYWQKELAVIIADKLN